ncbi:deoxyhypusine synthase [bacterium]|nr:deoxyhypusine synthase [bacterium]
MNTRKQALLAQRVVHVSLDDFNVVGMIDAMGQTAFQARNLARASHIVDRMMGDHGCVVILTLAGSLISAGLKEVIISLLDANMVDAIVSTGANIVDQDFFEALGFHHYVGTPDVDDHELRTLMIDRIYDTFIDEENLRVCDDTIAQLCGTLAPRPYSSREFIVEMGRYLQQHHPHGPRSIVRTAFEKEVPIFVPAFSDCSAGFGLVHHQHVTKGPKVTIDSAADFYEITQIKLAHPDTGIWMLGGGVPKNFVQDIVVAAEIITDQDVAMHKYAVQITVADERDGALSGSTLKEACSWGKVDTVYEQMVFSEATIAFPLMAGYAYHKGSWKGREGKRLNRLISHTTG